MPLYFCQPPTGYKDTADAWINTGALVEPDELRDRSRGTASSVRSPPRIATRSRSSSGPRNFSGASRRSVRLQPDVEGEAHGVPQSLREERRVRAGEPRLRAVVPDAHGERSGTNRARETAHRDLPARRRRRPQRRRPVWRRRVLPGAAGHRHRAAGIRTRARPSISTASSASTHGCSRSRRYGTTERWPLSTRADRPTRRGHTSTHRTTWNRRRRGSRAPRTGG